MMKIDLNVDMGESYGRWVLCDDAALMPYISSANIACGFHAGDPTAIRRTVREAVRHGLAIGAHVSLPDLMGFGRRRMALSPDEVRDYVLYQLGALAAFATAEGGRLEYVKPHGALYVMCADDPALADGLAAAIAEFDASMPLLLLNEKVADVVRARGVRLIREGFVDLNYDAAGNLVLERAKQAWDPALVAERALRLVREHRVRAKDGSEIEIETPTICLHGDAPNSIDVIRATRERLDAEGVKVAPLREILAAPAMA